MRTKVCQTAAKSHQNVRKWGIHLENAGESKFATRAKTWWSSGENVGCGGAHTLSQDPTCSNGRHYAIDRCECYNEPLRGAGNDLRCRAGKETFSRILRETNYVDERFQGSCGKINVFISQLLFGENKTQVGQEV